MAEHRRDRDEILATLSPARRALLEAQLEARDDRATSRTVTTPDDSSRAPLSFAQERLWVLEQLSPGSATHNVSRSVRIHGALDPDALLRALRGLVGRHESLRTVVEVTGDGPVQVVRPEPVDLPMPVVDLSRLAADDRLDRALSIVRDELNRPFDLASDLLLRAQLVRLADDDHVLALVTHHFAADDGSRAVFWRDLGELYAAAVEGREPNLDAVAMRYAQWAAWEREQAADGAFDDDLAWWRGALAGAAALDFPTDRVRPPVKSQSGARLSSHVSPAVADALRELARDAGATPFMATLAVFAGLLTRYTATSDVVIGSPASSRNRAELDDVIGCFVNSLVQRVDLGGDPTLRDAIGRAKQAVVGALTHQAAPFQCLVEELVSDRDTSRDPLFQVACNFLHSRDGRAPALPGLELELLDIDPGTSKLDLALVVTDDGAGGALELTWEYSTALFDRSTIERVDAHFGRLLAGAVAEPDAPLSAVTSLSAAEREQLVVTWNDTARPYSDRARVHELVAGQAARTPDRTAVVAADASLSYRELTEAANRLAHFLLGAGVQPGDRVGLYLERSSALVPSLLGVLTTGAAYVPLDPAFPTDRLADMAADSGLVAVVTQSSLANTLPLDDSVRVIALDGAQREAIAAQPSTDPAIPGSPHDLAYVIYTSGSTGRPKGVMVEHGNVVNFLESMAVEPGLGSDDVLLAVTTLSFDIAGLELFLPLLSGAKVVLAGRQTAVDPVALANEIDAHGVTVMQATPATWRMMIDAGWAGAPRLRVLCGGEALPFPLADALCARVGEVWNMYGPTETTIWSTVDRVHSGEPVRIGRPIANTTVYVLDARNAPVPVGVAGELFIGGVGVARGYHDRDDLTSARFVLDPFDSRPGARLYRTGDVVRRRADGRLEFLGRADEQVKVRGYRIELGEIETVLSSHPAVAAAVVVARRDEAEARLVAYVIAADREIGEPELRSHLATTLPGYMIPSAFVVLDAFPLTANGKVNRAALPAPSRVRDDAAFEAPAPGTESDLAALWGRVLDVDRVGATDDFFLLGGHSVTAARLAFQISSELGVEVPLLTLFERPVLREQAVAIEKARDAGSEPARPAAAPTLLPAPRSADGLLPVSFAQQRSWFLAQLEPDSPLYNVPVCYAVAGTLDVARLEQALTALVQRHEALRTTLVAREGIPYQHVGEGFAVVVATDDVATDDDAIARARAEAAAPFDIEAGPLVRARLIRVGGDHQYLCLTFHHLVCDGWSLNVVERELATLYSDPGALAARPLPIQYADFAAWEREWLQGDVLESELRWWRDRLAGAPAALELPTDRSRPVLSSYAGARRTLRIDNDTLGRLESIGHHENATLYMTLLAAVDVLLARYSGQDDIVVGSPVAGRTRTETTDLIGSLANTIVVRSDLSGDPTFVDLLRRVRLGCIGAFSHQDLPFEKLVEDLAPDRDLSRNPLFQVMVILQNEGDHTATLDGQRLSPVDVDRGVARFDLTFSFSRREGGLRVAIEYATELFDDTTIERLGSHLSTLLRGVADDPTRPLSKLPLLDESERRLILEEWNDTERAGDMQSCLHHVIARRARETPDARAVVDPAASITYAELDRRANQLARHLIGLGVAPGDLVGLHMQRCVDMMVAIVAILKAGAAYVPLEPSYPADRLAFMVDDAQLRVVCTQTSVADALPPHQAVLVRLDDAAHRAAIDSCDDTDPGIEVTARDLAYVIFTSGSTGRPKGVMIEHRGVVNLMRVMAERPGLRAGEVMIGPTTPAFDLSVPDLFLPLTTGACLAFAPPAVAGDPTALAQWIADVDADLMQATPATWRMLIDNGWPGHPKMRVVCGGEAYNAALVAELRARVAQVWNFYGPTEATVWCTTTELRDEPDPLPMGRPLPNYRVVVVDRAGEPAPIGVAGELCIGGVGLARGYLGRPDLTAEKFVPDPFTNDPDARLYRTGDLARWRADGQLEFVGRVDHQVKIRGFRIELGEIESILTQHPSVEQAVVLALGDGVDKRLVAYLTSASPAGSDTDDAAAPAELRAHLAEHVPPYMVPGAFVLLDAFPLTPNGKLDRKALPTPGATDEVRTPYVAPRTPLEEIVARLWEDLLDREQVGAEDNFFDLGGHSLRVTQLIARLRVECGVELPLRTAYERPTVAGIASAVSAELLAQTDDEGMEALLAALDEAELEDLDADGTDDSRIDG